MLPSHTTWMFLDFFFCYKFVVVRTIHDIWEVTRCKRSLVCKPTSGQYIHLELAGEIWREAGCVMSLCKSLFQKWHGSMPKSRMHWVSVEVISWHLLCSLVVPSPWMIFERFKHGWKDLKSSVVESCQAALYTYSFNALNCSEQRYVINKCPLKG